MNLREQKKMAARVMKCGVSRVRVTSTKEVQEALTRNEIRDLIKKGVIKKIQKKGQSSVRSKKIKLQKGKGRRAGEGRRKGTHGARNPKKRVWIKTVRGQRKFLTELKTKGQITVTDYRTLYRKVKGGMFRNKSHMLFYLKDQEILKPYDKSKDMRKPKTTKPVAKPKTAAPVKK